MRRLVEYKPKAFNKQVIQEANKYFIRPRRQ